MKGNRSQALHIFIDVCITDQMSLIATNYLLITRQRLFNALRNFIITLLFYQRERRRDLLQVTNGNRVESEAILHAKTFVEIIQFF